MLRSGLALLRALAGSETVRRGMCNVAAGAGPNTMSVALAALESFAAPSLAGDAPAAAVCEQAAATIGNLCLRMGEHAELAVARGALPLLAAAMRAHAASAGMQRAACLAVRNMVVRSKDRAAAAFAAGLEATLQAAYARHPTTRDVVYSALRDMGCEYAETTRGQEQAARAARAIAAGDISVK